MENCVIFHDINSPAEINKAAGNPYQLRINHEFNEFPDIIQYDETNPTLHSPNAMYDLPFYMTRETLLDVDVYKRFIENAVHRFRSSRAYKRIKSNIMALGLDHCQVLGYIKDTDSMDGMAKIEMHHNIIGIRDIAIMITEHIINTVGAITTFDLIQLLIQEHRMNNVPIVMLSETVHQMYESNPNSFIPPNMTFGKWWDLLYRYRYGITLDISYKIINYINKIDQEDPYKDFWIHLKTDVEDWSGYNVYGMDPGTSCNIGIIPDTDLGVNFFNNAQISKNERVGARAKAG